MCITATATFNGHELKDIPVLNPGDWFGKTWLLEIGGSYWPLFLIVESDSAQDAIDELAENAKYGRQIIVDDADLDDYPEADRHYSGSGRVLDLDHLMIHGQEEIRMPIPVPLPRRRSAGSGHEADRLLSAGRVTPARQPFI